MIRTRILPGLAALALVGCGTLGGGPAPATQENLVTASAVVRSVNQETREVALQDQATGETFTVVAGPEVRNLPQLEAGDVVQIDFYEAITAAMADPSAPPESGAVLAAAAPEGARPGGLAVTTATTVVQFVSYDANTAVATFITPDGLTRRATVPPEMRNFASSRTRGSRVAVTFTEAVAVTIAETGA